MHDVIEIVLPYIISTLEIMGIFVVVWSAITSSFSAINVCKSRMSDIA